MTRSVQDGVGCSQNFSQPEGVVFVVVSSRIDRSVVVSGLAGRLVNGPKGECMKLYVGNLAYSTDDRALESLFSQYGQVKSAQVVKDRDTGRSKGFAFVEFSDAKSANAAITGLNGKDVDGRALTVNEARPREERGGGGGGRSGGGGGYGGGGGGGYGGGGYGGGGGGGRSGGGRRY